LVHRLARNLSSHQVDLIYQNAYFAEPFTPELGYQELWSTVLPLSPEDASADPVASPKDITKFFRGKC